MTFIGIDWSVLTENAARHDAQLGVLIETAAHHDVRLTRIEGAVEQLAGNLPGS